MATTRLTPTPFSAPPVPESCSLGSSIRARGERRPCGLATSVPCPPRRRRRGVAALAQPAPPQSPHNRARAAIEAQYPSRSRRRFSLGDTSEAPDRGRPSQPRGSPPPLPSLRRRHRGMRMPRAARPDAKLWSSKLETAFSGQPHSGRNSKALRSAVTADQRQERARFRF